MTTKLERQDVTLATLITEFRDDDKCRTYLEHLRFPNGVACLRCGSIPVHRMDARGIFQCNACGYQFTVTVGTIFQDTRLPLRLWRTSRSRGKLFYRLAQQVVAVDPVPAKKILSRRSKP